MKLSPQDVKLFYQLNSPLLFFVHTRRNLAPDIPTYNDFVDTDINTKFAARNQLYDNINLIDEFCHENPFHFTKKELNIILSWKDFVRGKFIAYKQYQKYCAFIKQEEDASRVFAVLALTDDFAEVLPFSPCYVEMVLLPFKDSIIYDGLVAPYKVHFGSGIRASFKELFEIAKAKYGIIDKLPYVESDVQSDENLLRLYLKNEANMRLYEDEIDELINKNRRLLILFHQEMGKHNAKIIAKSLKQKGLKKKWFAIYDEVIVASGTDRKSVEENTRKILAASDLDFIYTFQV